MNNMEYKFIRDGIEESVQLEDWVWEAHYVDGSILKQFDDNGLFHQFKEIDQSLLAVFKMVSIKSDNQTFVLPFNGAHMKLIHFYRHVTLNFGDDNEQKIKLYCFGYEETILYKTVKHLAILTPQGETIMCSDPDVIDFK